MTRKWNPVTAVAAVFVVLACFAFLVSAVHGQTPRDPAGYPYNKMCYDRTGRLTHVYSDYLRQWVPAYGNLGVTEQRNARHYTDYYGTNWPPASGQLPPQIWGPNPPGWGWNPPGSNPTPGLPGLIDWGSSPTPPIALPPGQVTPPIYYPPGGIVSPPIYTLPGFPNNGLPSGGGNITVPINKFPLTINLGPPWYGFGGFGGGGGVAVPIYTPPPAATPYPYPPASWPSPESVARALRR